MPKVTYESIGPLVLVGENEQLCSCDEYVDSDGNSFTFVKILSNEVSEALLDNMRKLHNIGDIVLYRKVKPLDIENRLRIGIYYVVKKENGRGQFLFCKWHDASYLVVGDRLIHSEDAKGFEFYETKEVTMEN